jgi:hypothetical protein
LIDAQGRSKITTDSREGMRPHLRTSRSRDLPRFREIYEDVGGDTEREVRKDAGLAALAEGEASESPYLSAGRHEANGAMGM